MTRYKKAIIRPLISIIFLQYYSDIVAVNPVRKLDNYSFSIGFIHGACPLLLIPPLCIPALLVVYENHTTRETREASFQKGIKTGFSFLVIVGIYFFIKTRL